jgi:mono/diheme cytochrome c family protein
MAAAAVAASAAAQPSVGAPEGQSLLQQTTECAEQSSETQPACTTDVPTYVGWRVFGEYCATCHGPDALGSDFAPNLVQRMNRLDRQTFYAALDYGYFGRASEMEPWGDIPDVARYYEELWVYLSARAAGNLPPGLLRLMRTRPPSTR